MVKASFRGLPSSDRDYGSGKDDELYRISIALRSTNEHLSKLFGYCCYCRMSRPIVYSSKSGEFVWSRGESMTTMPLTDALVRRYA